MPQAGVVFKNVKPTKIILRRGKNKERCTHIFDDKKHNWAERKVSFSYSVEARLQKKHP